MLLDKTLRSSTLRLALIYVGLFAAAIIGLFGYVYWSTLSYVRAQSDRSISAERSVLDAAFAAGGRQGVIKTIDRRLRDPHFAGWVYLLVDPSLSVAAGNLEVWPRSAAGDSGWTAITGGQASLRAAYQRLANGDRVLVGRETKTLEGFARTVGLGLGAAVGLIILLATAAGISTARRSVSRIEAINATSREIMRAGLGRRIPLRGTGDEWDELAANLNSMLDRIGDLVEANRQVSDNIAHDLRTPLTRMRARLERASGQLLSASQYRSLLGEAIAELDGILRTFSSLLRISQIEARNPRAGFRSLDLAALVREVTELFDATAEENSVALRVGGEPSVSAFGDRDLLFDALSNLLDNAITHGGRGDEVDVTVGIDDDGPIVSVADRGPGIPLEEHRHVFKRFYRLERSRNSPGNGLGLSLVAAVANLHDVRIRIGDNAPGLRITLHFPLPPQSPVPSATAAAAADTILERQGLSRG